jgi:hypothetical protein
MTRPDKDTLSRLVGRLLASWRHDTAADREAAVEMCRAFVTVMAEYPPEVLEQIIDPRRGLPSRLKWFPTLAELVEACDAAFAPLQRRAAQEIALIETSAHLRQPDPETPEQRHAAVRYYEEALRPTIESAMPRNEQLREQQREEVNPQTPPETPQQLLDRMEAEGVWDAPLLVGEGLAAKLSSLRSFHGAGQA